MLTFEGLKNLEPVANFYNGGLGGNGSGPGPNYGITFGPDALALIENSVGGSGQFGGEPSPVTSLIFESGPGDVMDDPTGFTGGLSFFYSAPGYTGSVNVYSGLDNTGTILATLKLPTTPVGPSNKQYDPFLPIGISFNGVAKSVNFSGTAGYIAFDNITLGSSTPQGGFPGAVPEAPSLTLLSAGGAGLVLLIARRRRA